MVPYCRVWYHTNYSSIECDCSSHILQTTDVLFRDLEAANISVITTEVYQTDAMPEEEMKRIEVKIIVL